MKRWLAAAAAAAALGACGDSAAPQRWTPPAIASDEYESSPSFSPDGLEMFFMRADRRFASYRLLLSRCDGGRWGAPQSPPFAAVAPVDDADPFVSFDGRRLYFVSSRPHAGRAPGADDFDIWRVERDAQGRWGAPLPLPAPVNSTASELLPREDAQGRLIFGSSRAGGLGQGDIYMATPQPAGAWHVENLGPPVSSAAFEYEAELAQDGRTLVLVAQRGSRSHLYRFVRGRAARWVETGRLPGRDDVFQVGPLLSPRGEKLLFAQADGDRSGELFLVDLVPGSRERWPPDCR